MPFFLDVLRLYPSTNVPPCVVQRGGVFRHSSVLSPVVQRLFFLHQNCRRIDEGNLGKVELVERSRQQRGFGLLEYTGWAGLQLFIISVKLIIFKCVFLNER